MYPVALHQFISGGICPKVIRGLHLGIVQSTRTNFKSEYKYYNPKKFIRIQGQVFYYLQRTLKKINSLYSQHLLTLTSLYWIHDSIEDHLYKQVILISSNTYPEEKQILDHPQGLQLAHLFHSIGWKQKNITRWNLAWNTDLKISAFLFLIKKKYCHWILTFAILLYHKMLLLIKVNLIIDQLILLN